MPAKRGRKGKAAGYSLREVRDRERALNEQAEHAYPARRRLARQATRLQVGRGRRQWGATLEALKRGNSCAAGTSP
jgi:hypothetical protein